MISPFDILGEINTVLLVGLYLAELLRASGVVNMGVSTTNSQSNAMVTIIHNSDLHNKISAEQARYINELKEEHPGSLMLDSGDAIWSGNIYWRPGGEPILDLMNSVPYDALCMGNREYHFLGIGINSKTSRAVFPILSANIRSAKSPSPLAGEENAVVRWVHAGGEGSLSPSPLAGEGRGEGLTFTRSGLRITVFGLTVPCITERMLVKKISSYYFDQPISTAAELVPKLRPECDILIALTHIGINVDRELAKQVPGIDLILGGHTHTVAEERVGKTTILHHGFYGHYAGKFDIDCDSNGITIKNELIPLPKA